MEQKLGQENKLDTAKLTIHEGRYLTFTLCDDEYGIEVLKIMEIVGMMDVFPLNKVPAYVKGVINIRGRLIPVIDLMSKFGFPGIQYTKEACIIIMEVHNILTGVVVDVISEVHDVSRDDLEPLPDIGKSVNPDTFTGMAKMKGRAKMLLDMDKVLGNEWPNVVEKLDLGNPFSATRNALRNT